MELNKKQMQYVGCLLGGAAGDALGYAVEFYDDATIFRKYGEKGITEYRLCDGVAFISDDTQMTLFTAEGLLRSSGYTDAVASLYRSYLDWYKTQEQKPSLFADGLLKISELYSCRAPGATCLGALGCGICGTLEAPVNGSKGCGGIMRVAPVALYCHCRGIARRDSAMLAARAAAITHGHELGYIPAAIFSDIIYLILDDYELSRAVNDAMQLAAEMFAGSGYVSNVLALLKRAVVLAGEELDDLDAIRELGEGWVAEETLAISVYCALKHKNDFSAAIIASVNHSGDSDSTGSVTGNIIGAVLGSGAIPAKFIVGLELAETVVDTALSLYRPLVGE